MLRMLLSGESGEMFGLFFFQAEDGIRDYKVTGVQTCALPISPDDVTEAMEMGPAYVPLSLDQPVGTSDGQDNRSVAEQIGSADPELERVEMRDVLDRAMEHLTPRERAIMAMRFYEQMSQSEIARRLGISQMH